jgi:hypothetical protein
MSITFVYRDENNKVQVKKIKYEEAKKDLIKYMSHDIRTIMKEKLNFCKRRGQ